MKRSPVSLSLLWLISRLIFIFSGNFSFVESHHILGLFVNVHRSQMLVHLAVCRALLHRGHQLTLVTTLPLQDPEWRVENVTHILIPWQQPENEGHGSPTDFLERLERMFKRLEKSGDLLDLWEWKSFMQQSPIPHYDLLLLGYHFNDHLLGVAAHFKCPVAIINTQQPTGFVNSLMGNPEERWYVPQPYDSQQRSGIRAWLFGVWEKLMEVMARRVISRIYRLGEFFTEVLFYYSLLSFIKSRFEFQFSPYSNHFPEPRYPSFDTVRKSVVLALNNHHAISEGPIAPVLPNMVDIGGIVLEQKKIQETSMELGSGKRSIILFSLGTRFTWRKSPQHLVDTFTTAFSLYPDYDIYWTYDGPNGSAISLDYQHLKVGKWWSQIELLGSGRTRLFITHGGKGSVSEALFYGVPMLGLPLLGDQRANLKKMHAKTWGLTLPTHNLTHSELSKAMGQILSHSDYAVAISKASELYRDRPQKSSDLATFWIEYIIRHGGANNLYSPARNLGFIEYHFIDVYVTIYGGLVVMIIILRKLYRLLCD
ncbi:hypothetical protein KR009_003078 [Drosophila setifemur]|nr:hypothetical protein KR009_003078 [Drosophila setifemur]